MKITFENVFTTDINFESISLQVFRFQYENNLSYKTFCDLLHTDIKKVTSIDKIPFIPISLFKSNTVVSGVNSDYEIKFTSSGTTGDLTSSHFVKDITWYTNSYIKGFELTYGSVSEYTILALLPSYLERNGSSLIYMVEDLITKSNSEHSGFYLHNHKELIQKIHFLENSNKKTILIGVTFALLDLIEKEQFQLKNTIIMETGGMKGKRKEMIREELHDILCKGFGVSKIHSEYGMTELLSQAYSKGDGIFDCPPWMKVLIRDTEDALTYLPDGKTGGINVIDLANINSCSFIATQDLGKKHPNNSFEVLGRFDNSDIRGCNLMVI